MASEKTIVFITGANSGIGLETVLALSQASPDFHILLGARSIEKGEKALSEIRSSAAAHPGGPLKGTISVVQIDVSDEASIRAAASRIESDHGKLDALINNAGIVVTRPGCDTLTNLRETFETNVFGPMLLTEVLEPLLKKSNKTPYIIHVSSGLGSVGLRLDPDDQYRGVRAEAYRMSKAAMNMMAACHRYNYRAEGLGWKVCAFNPGYCVTNLTGAEDREKRTQNGARPARDPAEALVEIVQGKRDGDLAMSGIVDLDGGVLPW